MAKITYLTIAMALCDGFHGVDINDVASRLETANKDWGLSLQELDDKCWEDSASVFDAIY